MSDELLRAAIVRTLDDVDVWLRKVESAPRIADRLCRAFRLGEFDPAKIIARVKREHVEAPSAPPADEEYERGFSDGEMNGVALERERVQRRVKGLVKLVGHCDNPECEGKWCVTARDFLADYAGTDSAPPASAGGEVTLGPAAPEAVIRERLAKAAEQLRGMRERKEPIVCPLCGADSSLLICQDAIGCDHRALLAARAAKG